MSNTNLSPRSSGILLHPTSLPAAAGQPICQQTVIELNAFTTMGHGDSVNVFSRGLKAESGRSAGIVLQPISLLEPAGQAIRQRAVIELNAFETMGHPESGNVVVFGRGLKQMPPHEATRLCLESGRSVLRKAGIVEH